MFLILIIKARYIHLIFSRACGVCWLKGCAAEDCYETDGNDNGVRSTTDYSTVLGAADEYGSGIDGANGYKHVAPLCLLFG